MTSPTIKVEICPVCKDKSLFIFRQDKTPDSCFNCGYIPEKYPGAEPFEFYEKCWELQIDPDFPIS